jgi:NADPH2:quinone reductase
MRAAVIERVGERPVVREVPDPAPSSGQALVQVSAATLNPIDVSIAAGRFHAGPPQTPYVAGKEGVGRVREGTAAVEAGTRVRFAMPGGLGGPGAMAELAAADEDEMVELPEDVDDPLAAALGIAGLAAWLGLEWRAQLREGESVLVLGASGPVGVVAVQAARLLGARRVVAAARSREGLDRARELGAHAVVELDDGGSPEQLAETIRDAAEGPVDVTIDPLWGKPVAAAAYAATERGRIVQIGQSAGAEAKLPSGPVRGKLLSILGHTSTYAPRDVVDRIYLRLVEHAAEGRLTLDHEVLPLDQAPEAWRRQEEFPRRKLVLSP